MPSKPQHMKNDGFRETLDPSISPATLISLVFKDEGEIIALSKSIRGYRYMYVFTYVQ